MAGGKTDIQRWSANLHSTMLVVHY